MAQLTVLRNKVFLNILSQISQQLDRCYGTVATAPTSTATTIAMGRPFNEIPTVNKLKLILDFMPGGKYSGGDVSNIVKGLLKDTGSDIAVFSGTFGKKSMIITQNPDDFETIYRHDGVWPNRRSFEILNYHRSVHRKDYFGEDTGLMTSEDAAWGNMRSAVNPIIVHPKNVKIYLPALDRINKQFIDRIKTIRDAQSLEVPENFKDEISAWAMESVGMVALDRQLGLIDSSNPTGRYFFTLLQRFFDLAVELEIKPSLWRQIKTPKFWEVIHVLDETLRITDEYVEEAIGRFKQATTEKADSEKSVLEKLLAINRKYAVSTAMEMMFAGIDTTTTTFVGTLLTLAKHPEKQEKLRAEIRDILPEKETPLTVESMKNLPYLRACIKESMRCYPVFPGNIRTTREDLVLSGYNVPKGSMIAMMHLNIWQDSKHFSEPEKFVPERWLRSNQSKPESSQCPAPATKSNHPFAYLPFGFGSRSCIGRRIAEMEVEIGIARILRNFKLEFNHSTDNAFFNYQVATPRIPLHFKFTDLKD